MGFPARSSGRSRCRSCCYLRAVRERSAPLARTFKACYLSAARQPSLQSGIFIVRSRLAPPLILTSLALLFFAPLVVHPAHVLYSDHSDMLAHYLPAKRFFVEAWREARE